MSLEGRWGQVMGVVCFTDVWLTWDQLQVVTLVTGVRMVQQVIRYAVLPHTMAAAVTTIRLSSTVFPAPATYSVQNWRQMDDQGDCEARDGGVYVTLQALRERA